LNYILRQIQTTLSWWQFRIRHILIWSLFSQWQILLPPKLLTFSREPPCKLNYTARQIQTALFL
jgi:hypothetical protein